jgi:GxxExxY protein
MVELLEKELVFQIVGCAMTVLNEIGHGLREKTYELAISVELRYQNIPFSRQKIYSVYYRGELIDEYIPDLEVDKRVICDLKTVDCIIDEHRGQVLNYLRISKKKVGLILNFKHPKLEWERLVLDRE